MRYKISNWSHFIMFISCIIGVLIAAFPGLYPNMQQSDWYVFLPIGATWLSISIKTWIRNGSAYIEIRDDKIVLAKMGKERTIPFSDLNRIGNYNGFIFLVTKGDAIIKLPLLYENQNVLLENLRMNIRHV